MRRGKWWCWCVAKWWATLMGIEIRLLLLLRKHQEEDRDDGRQKGMKSEWKSEGEALLYPIKYTWKFQLKRREEDKKEMVISYLCIDYSYCYFSSPLLTREHLLRGTTQDSVWCLFTKGGLFIQSFLTTFLHSSWWLALFDFTLMHDALSRLSFSNRKCKKTRSSGSNGIFKKTFTSLSWNSCLFWGRTFTSWNRLLDFIFSVSQIMLSETFLFLAPPSLSSQSTSYGNDAHGPWCTSS